MAPPNRWYKFEPEDAPEGGVYTTPLMGEVEVGKTYEVPEQYLAAVADSPDWHKSTQKAAEASADDGDADGGEE